MSGLTSPTAMQFSPDGRLFVCEQGGKLLVIKNGTLLPSPFLTLSVSSSGERGLLGVAFDPDFAVNQYVYVYYTAMTPAIHNRISRFTANGDVALAGSEVVLFELDNLSSATNHNGGALAFGLDGKLYAAVGENATPANSQSLNNVLGKMLRINPDGSIPTDNPFYATAVGKNRAIWALGLRNPFTFGIHPFDGRLFINDVGEGGWEEVNDGLPGANYGWPETEGYTSDPRFVSPRYAYTHHVGCAITGGAFYAPVNVQFPSDYVNDYFFADLCGGWIRKLDPNDGNSIVTFATNLPQPVDVKVGSDGSLYYLARDNGGVYRIQFGASAPSITAHPTSQTVAPGSSVTFSVRASGPPPLRYQWQRNGVNIPGATGQDYTLVSAGGFDNGARFRVSVSNDFGSVLSNDAVLTVTQNQRPTANISQPSAGALYRAGAVVNYSGTGTDAEDGTLAGNAFTWRIDFHHDTHSHPFIPATSGSSSGTFTVPTTGETSANVWYRIYLTVSDSGGLTHTTQRDIFPEKARLTLATSPSGLQLHLDGQPVATPFAFDSVVGIVRTIGASATQQSSGTTYAFASWSDGGAASHSVATPAADTTYIATYTATPPPTSISFVQSQGVDAGWTSSASLAFPSANTAGNFIVVIVRASGLNQVFTVQDTRRNQYKKAAQVNVSNDGVSLAIFYAENVSGGSNAVTVSHTQAGTLRLAILEYSGVAASGSLGRIAVAEGTSAAPSSGYVTAAGNTLLIGILTTANSASVAPGSGYTLRTTVPANLNAKLAIEDRLQPADGPAAATASLGAPDNWGILLATFLPGAAPPPTPPASPGSPSPANGASNVTTTPTLAWTASGATSYDVRFGTSSTPPLVAANLTTTNYAPAALTNGTTYFWQIVARNSAGSTTGPVWSFATAPAAPPVTIGFVQSNGTDAGWTSSASLAFSSANTAGNFIAVVVRASGLDQVFTVSDALGNQYRKAAQFNVTNDGVSLGVFYAENVFGGSNAVTVTTTQAGTLRLGILEYSGVATSGSFEVSVAAQGTGISPNSGTATTGGSALIMGVVTTANPASVTPGTSFTLRRAVPANPNAKLAIEDRLQPAAGPAAATASLTASDNWGMLLVGFRSTGG